MHDIKFNLVDHTMDIQKIADANKCSIDDAIGLFLSNLAVMNEHYKGAGHLNYRALGQLWNSLNSTERNNQKAELRSRLVRSKRGGSIE